MPPFSSRTSVNTGDKRAHSAGTSSSGTPVSEKPPILDDLTLPAFLQLQREEVKEKFDQLNYEQALRFDQLRKAQDPSQSLWAIDQSKAAKMRNRYLDIKPWSKTRVSLKVPEGEFDYINASHILLKCNQTGIERKYIATQGPKETGVEHFWQMVWQETDQVAVIVMLTQLVENQREKCFPYYPEGEETEPLSMSFRTEAVDIEATLNMTESAFDDDTKSTIRTFTLSCGEETKTVHHFLFCGWPDHGVPIQEERSALFELVKSSRVRNGGWENPRIVHCSAGVGRSGTFIALEHLFEELEQGQFDDLSITDSSVDPIRDTVDLLRQQRMMMVQSEEQFQFLYSCVTDAFVARAKERAIAAQLASKSKGSGEPAHKAVRLTKQIRNVFSSLRSRSSSRKGLDRVKSTDSSESKDGEQAKMGNQPKGPQVTSSTASKGNSDVAGEDNSSTADTSSQELQSQSPEYDGTAESGLTQDAAQFRISENSRISDDAKSP